MNTEIILRPENAFEFIKEIIHEKDAKAVIAKNNDFGMEIAVEHPYDCSRVVVYHNGEELYREDLISDWFFEDSPAESVSAGITETLKRIYGWYIYNADKPEYQKKTKRFFDSDCPTVGELIDALSDFDRDLPIACYSREGECDFQIDEIEKAYASKFGVHYCQDYTTIENLGEIVILSGGSR